MTTTAMPSFAPAPAPILAVTPEPILAPAPAAPAPEPIAPLTPAAIDLAARCMLVDLDVSIWEGRKRDKRVSDDVAAQHGSDPTMGTYWKLLMKDGSLAKVHGAARRLQEEHKRRTLPWLDNGGGRALTNAAYFDYQRVMGDRIRECEDAADEFQREYPRIVNEMHRSLGTLFNPADYPTQSEIRGKFSFRFKLLPLPTAADFRCLTGADLDRARDSIARDTEERMAQAQRDLVERVADKVGAMAERLRAYKPADGGGKAEGTFHYTLIEHVRDLAEVLPSLNLTGDPRLDSIAAEMRAKLCLFGADTLKQSAAVRERTAAAADSILAKMGDFI